MPNPTKQCISRLQKELRNSQKEPDPLYTAAPLPDDILTWYFVFNGPADSAYQGGRYIGKLKLPHDYPFKPPAILMCTPNGRFLTDTKICLSNSSFHPEQWNPMWTIGTIITGLISFLLSDDNTTGVTVTTDEVKRELASASRAYNVTKLANVYKNSLPAEYASDCVITEEKEKAFGGASSRKEAGKVADPASERFEQLPACAEESEGSKEMCAPSSSSTSSSLSVVAAGVTVSAHSAIISSAVQEKRATTQSQIFKYKFFAAVSVLVIAMALFMCQFIR